MTLTTSKKRLKTLLVCLTLAVMLFALAMPCFAWTRLPFESANNDYCFTFKTDTSDLNFCIYAYSHDGTYWYVSIDGLTFSYLTPDLLDELVYVPIKSTSPTEQQARQIIQNEIAKFENSFQGKYVDNLTDVYFNEGYQEGYYTGYDDGTESQYAYQEGYNDGYHQGESDGLDTAETGKNLILTIFSVPSYVLSNVFNFEIFGINLYSLICFLLTISIIGIVLKKIL